MPLARSGPVPAFFPGQIGFGRGERETRGEHRGRGERLPSGSRFVFPGTLFLLLVLQAAPLGAQAQPRPTGFTISVRAGGVYGTRLVADDIGQSVLPDTLLIGRFRRESVMVQMPIAPDLSLVAGLPLSDETELQVAAGYTIGRLDVVHAGAARDGGDVMLGHGTLSIRKPIRGVLGRVGVGALWFQGADMVAIRDMRRLNPLVELAVTRRWTRGVLEVEAGLMGQAAHLTSAALELRQAPGGMFYRLGLELSAGRRIGR